MIDNDEIKVATEHIANIFTDCVSELDSHKDEMTKFLIDGLTNAFSGIEDFVHKDAMAKYSKKKRIRNKYKKKLCNH